jgi:hypothetical protein
MDLVAFESTILPFIGKENLTDTPETWRNHFKKNVLNLYRYIDLQATIFLVAVHDAIAQHWYLMTADTRTK